MNFLNSDDIKKKKIDLKGNDKLSIKHINLCLLSVIYTEISSRIYRINRSWSKGKDLDQKYTFEAHGTIDGA